MTLNYLKICFLFLIFSTLTFAQSNPIKPNQEALISSERKLQAIDDVASISITYNFDQKVGISHQGSTQYTKLISYLPYRINANYSYVIEPTISYQYFNNFDGYSSSGLNPIIIQSFLTQSNQAHRNFSYGLGPMIQIRTNMPWMYGSSQDAAGYSLGAMYRTEDWSLGFTGYQSFGVGSNPTIGATANNIYLKPVVTYITKRYGNYTLDAEPILNLNNGTRSLPINLTGSKLVDFGNIPLLFTLGVRYYATNTLVGGAQGWGGRIGLTYAFSK